MQPGRKPAQALRACQQAADAAVREAAGDQQGRRANRVAVPGPSRQPSGLTMQG